MESFVIPAGGGRLHAYAWGKDRPGVPFLLVHGLASNALLWGGVGRALAGHGHPAVAVDLRGHGRSWKPDDGYDFATVGKDLLDVVANLGWDRPVIAGQSWGANVVLDLAASHPDALRGGVLVDGGWLRLRSRFPTWESCQAALSPPALAGTPVGRMRAWMADRYAGWSGDAVDAALGCFEVLDDGTLRPWLTRERHLMILRHLWEHDPPARYPEVGVPVLLVPADDASAWSVDKRSLVEEAARALPLSRTHWFAAHHDVHLQLPDQLAAVLHGAVADGFMA